MLNLIFWSSSYGSHLFWVKALAAFLLAVILYLLSSVGLRRFRFKEKDLKDAKLNHNERREWLAKSRRKLKEAARPRKKLKRHF